MSDYTTWPDMGPLRHDRVFPDRPAYYYAHLDKWASISRHCERWIIRTIHPYDLTDYHEAYSDDGVYWRICRDIGGTWKPKIKEITSVITKDAHRVVALLRMLDKPLKANIDRS